MGYQELIESIAQSLLETKNPRKLAALTKNIIASKLGVKNTSSMAPVFSNPNLDIKFLLVPNASRGEEEVTAPEHLGAKQGKMKLQNFIPSEENDPKNPPIPLPGSGDRLFAPIGHSTSSNPKRMAKRVLRSITKGAPTWDDIYAQISSWGQQ